MRVKFEALRVLVVDDMPAVRAIVREMLQGLGFRQIDEAEDGEAAWRLVKQSVTRPVLRYDLLISDWLMPGMDGIELVTRVRDLSATRALPFLMITSQNDRHHWLKAEDAGVSGFVVKPFDAVQLGEEIARALGS